ncbi:MAG: hypothetical protein OXC06_00125, partial [Acidimicrobiaceae bacterium]|nr:hypothetical protein [Acidimicrobiaceae bacterium]
MNPLARHDRSQSGPYQGRRHAQDRRSGPSKRHPWRTGRSRGRVEARAASGGEAAGRPIRTRTASRLRTRTGSRPIRTASRLRTRTGSRPIRTRTSDSLRTRTGRAGDERGDYAIFIAVIAAALLLFGSIAYDAPRLIAARQNALHEANEAARVAAATIAAGGTVDQARSAAEDRLSKSLPLYGQPVALADLECVGTLAQVTVVTNYVFRGAVLGAGI